MTQDDINSALQVSIVQMIDRNDLKSFKRYIMSINTIQYL